MHISRLANICPSQVRKVPTMPDSLNIAIKRFYGIYFGVYLRVYFPTTYVDSFQGNHSRRTLPPSAK